MKSKVFCWTGRDGPLIRSKLQHDESRRTRSDWTRRTQKHQSTPLRREFKSPRPLDAYPPATGACSPASSRRRARSVLGQRAPRPSLTERQALQTHSPSGVSHFIEPHSAHRSSPWLHPQPSYLDDDRGQPRPRHTAHWGSGTRQLTGHTRRQSMQSLQSKGSTT